MNKFAVELEWDAVDSIVVQALKNQYNGLKEELAKWLRQAADDVEKYEVIEDV